MKFFLPVAFFVGFLALPFFSHAAFDDVTLETTAVIQVGAYDLTVSGSSAVIESIEVGVATFTVDLTNGSSITVASADRVDFAYDVEAETTTETCTDSQSTLTLSVASAGATTVVVTPSGTCTAAEEEEDSGGGGGTSYRKDTENPTPSFSGNDAAIESIMQQIIELLQQLIAQLIAQQGQ